MKKTFIFGLMAAALGFTACSNEADAILGENTQKGMVLNATVEQPAETRATIDNSTATWTFAFETDDEVNVINPVDKEYYTFTKGTTNFTSTDAKATATATKWYAFFPSYNVLLINQSGQLTDEGKVPNLYAMRGVTTEDTTGESGLSITMQPKVAILKIDNQKGDIAIRARTSDDKYVRGLTVEASASNEYDFNLVTTTDPTSACLFSTGTKGTYYVAVPAGVYLTIMDGNEIENSTKTTGFTAGKYYELKIENAVRPTYVSSSPATQNSEATEGPSYLVDAAGATTKWCDWNSDGKWEMVVSISAADKLKTIKLWNTNDTEDYPQRIWKSLKVSGSATGTDGTWTEIKDFTDLGLSVNNFGLAGELQVNATAQYKYYKLEVAVDPYTAAESWDNDNTMQMADMKFVLGD